MNADNTNTSRRDTGRAATSGQMTYYPDQYKSEREYWAPHHAEQLLDAKWRRYLRLIVAGLALLISSFLMFLMIRALYFSPVDNTVATNLISSGNETDMWIKIAVISGTFLTFIIIFGALIRGLFAADRDAEKHAPTNPRLNPAIQAMEMSQGNPD